MVRHSWLNIKVTRTTTPPSPSELAVAQGFKGGVMIVSHDQHFINKVCSELWVVGSGEVAKYPGEFDDYKNEQIAKRKAAGASL